MILAAATMASFSKDTVGFARAVAAIFGIALQRDPQGDLHLLVAKSRRASSEPTAKIKGG